MALEEVREKVEGLFERHQEGEPSASIMLPLVVLMVLATMERHPPVEKDDLAALHDIVDMYMMSAVDVLLVGIEIDRGGAGRAAQDCLEVFERFKAVGYAPCQIGTVAESLLALLTGFEGPTNELDLSIAGLTQALGVPDGTVAEA